VCACVCKTEEKTVLILSWIGEDNMRFELDDYEIGVVINALNLTMISAGYVGNKEAWEAYKKVFEKIARGVNETLDG
jgi:hypothetical protein